MHVDFEGGFCDCDSLLDCLIDLGEGICCCVGYGLDHRPDLLNVRILR